MSTLSDRVAPRARAKLSAWLSSICSGGARAGRHGTEVPIEEQTLSGLERKLENTRVAYRRLIDEWEAKTGRMFIPYAETIPPKLLERCRLFPSREYIFKAIPKQWTIVEVGTQTGIFAKTILELASPARLHLIDIDWSRFNEDYIAGHEAIVERHDGDSAQVLASFPDDYFDLVYLDADHSLEAVERDIYSAKSKVKPGGYLVFNDYTVWSPREVYKYGVLHAVNAFCAKEQWPVVFFAFQGTGYHDIALQRPHA